MSPANPGESYRILISPLNKAPEPSMGSRQARAGATAGLRGCSLFWGLAYPTVKATVLTSLAAASPAVVSSYAFSELKP